MPNLKPINQSQFTTQEANESRKVTKVNSSSKLIFIYSVSILQVRWIVEYVNGRLKQQFKLFDHVIQNSKLPNIKMDMRIACALLNLTHKAVYADNDEVAMGKIMKLLENKKNPLIEIVERENLDRKRSGIFQPIDAIQITDFPVLDKEDLYKITLGKY